jgi:hypothetical protein
MTTIPPLDCSPEQLLALQQYFHVVNTGQIAIDVLERLVAHDRHHSSPEDPGQFARHLVLRMAKQKGDLIQGAKLVAEPGDWGYGDEWPLPPTFSEKPTTSRDDQTQGVNRVRRQPRTFASPLQRGFVGGLVGGFVGLR